MDALAMIIDLGTRHRTVQIRYQKPAKKEASQRLVEPYKLLDGASSVCVRCWQLSCDDADSEPGFKSFRADRIIEALDGGCDFEPRTGITLHLGEMHPAV